MSFTEIIDSVETLSIDDQIEIARIINSRLIDIKRNEIYNNWQSSISEYLSNKIKALPYESAILELE